MQEVKWILLVIFPATRAFNLTIVHTNDIHAHYEQTNVHLGPCSAQDTAEDKCYGGYPRLVTKVKEFRALRPNNTIVLSAGDQYQGTPWFYYFGGNVTAEFVNWINYDVMALGNHEFDRGIDGLLPFLKQVHVPIISANIDASSEPEMKDLFNKTVVLTVGGHKIGVIGYTTVDTPSIADTGNLNFDAIIPIVKQEVAKLESMGINIIIALGHAGYQFDQQLAREVEGLDIVVGGHSHSFLYTGDPPSTEKPVGRYPTMITQKSGVQVPVVQAFCYSKYIGHMELEFDDQGKVTHWEGSPILLDKNTTQDEATLQKMVPWEAAINSSSLKVVGSTAVLLQGDEHHCRKMECNLGNVYTDAMIDHFVRTTKAEDGSWTTVAIALSNGGGIRTSMEVGDINMKGVLSVLPFRNEVDRIVLKGEYLLLALEHAVSKYPKKESDDLNGGFLQMSGLVVTYDVYRPVGQRVVDVQVRCAQCQVPVFEPLDVNANYTIALPMFTANGGDGYTMITDHMIPLPPTNSLDSAILVDYINRFSPLTQGVEARIRFLSPEVGSTSVVLQAADERCLKGECNLGNAFADAMVYAFNRLQYNDTGDNWAKVALSLVHGSWFNMDVPEGPITRVKIEAMLKERGNIELVTLKGSYLLQALEHSVAMYPAKEGEDWFEGFLQMSGISVSYDVSKAVGDRVSEVRLLCAACDVPVYQPLDPDTSYTIALPTVLADGGFGYTMIKENGVKLSYYDTPDTIDDMEVFVQYVQQFSPLAPAVEERMRFSSNSVNEAQSALPKLYVYLVLCVVSIGNVLIW